MFTEITVYWFPIMNAENKNEKAERGLSYGLSEWIRIVFVPFCIKPFEI